MTLRELAKKLNALVAVHGDCEIKTTGTDGNPFWFDILEVEANVTAFEGDEFPIVLLHLETDGGKE